MNSSNSFNLCPHCGNSNTLNARFCSRCGTQLKVPEEVVVCRTCGTRNSPMANFCRNCGSQLKLGEQTKICPRCRKEVPVGDNTCACGYSFATITTVSPDAGKPVALREEQKGGKKKGKVKQVASRKGGRAFAIIAFIFLALFAYFFAAPARFRPSFLAFDKGLVTDANGHVWYGLPYIITVVQNVIGAIKAPNGNMVGAILNALGGSIAEKIVTFMTIIVILSAFVHFIVCVARMFSKKRSLKTNKLYLILAILTTIATALILVPQYLGTSILWGILSIFAAPAGVSFGWVICAVPAYFWFFFLYSAIAKSKPLTEEVA